MSIILSKMCNFFATRMDKTFVISELGIEFLHTIKLENIPPMSQTDLYLGVTFIRKKRGRSVGTF
jgi:hypothetical protein